MKKITLSAFAILFSTIYAVAQSPFWVKNYNGQASGSDQASVMTHDMEGNILTAGYADLTGNSSDDIILVKYKPDGTILWETTFNGKDNKGDVPKAITTDINGNIYITGHSGSKASDDDLIILKYDKNGNQKWLKIFNGTYDYNDDGLAIEVDANANVYTTGYVYNTDNDKDIITIKLDSNGDTLWTKTFNGNGSYDDEGKALALDTQGNVYVTGHTYTSGESDNLIVIKYDNNGNQKWIKQENGTRNSDDKGNEIILDSFGSIYVAGQLYNKLDDYKDFVVIKYDTSGNQKWIKTYKGTDEYHDEAQAMVSDNATNIYVAGYLDNLNTGRDFFTVKLDTSGTEIWTRTFNSEDDNDDAGIVGISYQNGLVAILGNTYRSGSGYDVLAVAYDTAGTEKWSVFLNGTYDGTDNPASIASVDDGSVLLLTSLNNKGSGDDITIIKIDSAGKNSVFAKYDSKGNGEDKINASVFDTKGNIIVTGYSMNGGNSKDITTIKYDKNGAVQWVKTFNGKGNDDDIGLAIAVDAEDNVIVTGKVYSDSTNNDLVIIKYGADGTMLWSDVYNGTYNGSDEGVSTVADGAGNIYVTGSVRNKGAYWDVVTFKYSKEGTRIWLKVYNGADDDEDGPVSMAIDKNANIFITGYTYLYKSDYDILTIKYDSSGTEKWVKLFDGTANGTDSGNDIVVDGSGNAYLTGYAGTIGKGSDIITIKYDSNGNRKWLKTFNGTSNSKDEGVALVLGKDDNILVTGNVTNLSSGIDITTIKYDNSGEFQWSKSFDGTATGNDDAKAIAADASGNVFVTGTSLESATGDIVTIAYDTKGDEKWKAIYSGKSGYRDYAASVLADDKGAVYVSGSTTESGYELDMTLLKYCDLPASIITSDSIKVICQGQTVNIQAVPVVDSYLWSNGSTSQNIKAAETGIYSVNVSNANGCFKQSDSISVKVKPVPDVNLELNGSAQRCLGDSVGIKVKPALSNYSYKWSNGKTTSEIFTKISGAYSVTIADTNGCSAIAALPVNVLIKSATPAVPLCVVTVDEESENNILAWEKVSAEDIVSYKIYREGTNGYQPLVTIPFKSTSVYTDTTADPNVTFYRYKMATIDTCGNESDLSDFHKTMFIQANLGVGGVINLSWNLYEGVNVNYYRIMRDESGTGSFQKIDSVSNSTNVYTDVNAKQFPNARYKVEFILASSCETSKNLATVNTTRSNIKNSKNLTSVRDITELNSVNIYPNPASSVITVETKGFSDIAVFNTYGQLVYTAVNVGGANKIDISGFAKGVYTLKIESGNKAKFSKFVVK